MQKQSCEHLSSKSSEEFVNLSFEFKFLLKVCEKHFTLFGIAVNIIIIGLCILAICLDVFVRISIFIVVSNQIPA